MTTLGIKSTLSQRTMKGENQCDNMKLQSEMMKGRGGWCERNEALFTHTHALTQRPPSNPWWKLVAKSFTSLHSDYQTYTAALKAILLLLLLISMVKIPLLLLLPHSLSPPLLISSLDEACYNEERRSLIYGWDPRLAGKARHLTLFFSFSSAFAAEFNCCEYD